MTSATLLLRTPFQAWLAQLVLEQEQVQRYDVLYLTQNNSAEDRRYFEVLAHAAQRSDYCYVPALRPDILNHLVWRLQVHHWFRDRRHDLVLLASIDSFVINAIAMRQSSTLVTFDDGMANLQRSSSYRRELLGSRGRWYRRLFGAQDLISTQRRIKRHYTIYPGFENIVPATRVCALRGWGAQEPKHTTAGLPVTTFFIGQPLGEALTPAQITALTRYLCSQSIDWYVRHPRESAPLPLGRPLLEKNGLIAEDAILSHSMGRSVHLLSWFSSVSINLARVVERSTVVLFRHDSRFAEQQEIAQRAGCSVVVLDH
jgi:N-acetyllactosaminide alpha-2,3-sialyltransferase